MQLCCRFLVQSCGCDLLQSRVAIRKEGTPCNARHGRPVLGSAVRSGRCRYSGLNLRSRRQGASRGCLPMLSFRFLRYVSGWSHPAARSLESLPVHSVNAPSEAWICQRVAGVEIYDSRNSYPGFCDAEVCSWFAICWFVTSVGLPKGSAAAVQLGLCDRRPEAAMPEAWQGVRPG